MVAKTPNLQIIGNPYEATYKACPWAVDAGVWVQPAVRGLTREK